LALRFRKFFGFVYAKLRIVQPHRSIRFDIIRRSLEDITARLAEMAPSLKTRELNARAEQLMRRVKDWDYLEPSAEQRAIMMEAVLDLNLAVIEHGRS
jgi:hypothetical protein